MVGIPGKTMNAERWKWIEEVYHSALPSPPAGRAALLDELCSGDCDMRREVESLLEARSRREAFFHQSIYTITSRNWFPSRPWWGRRSVITTFFQPSVPVRWARCIWLATPDWTVKWR